MKPIIICGFSGIGKTHSCYSNEEFTILDMDANLFINDESWNFPEDYVKALDEVIGYPGEPDFIMMSTHHETRNELHRVGLPYVIVYPHHDRKDEIVARIEKREVGKENGDMELSKRIAENYDEWISDLENDDRAVLRVPLTGENNLDDVLSYVKNEVKKHETKS